MPKRYDAAQSRTLLVELYRVSPRSRSTPAIWRMLKPVCRCRLKDIADYLAFLASLGIVACDNLNYWRITSTGILFAENQRLV